MPSGQRGPLKPQQFFHAPVAQYLNVLPLAGQADGSGGSNGNLTSQDAITAISAGFGNQTIWALDSGVLLDTGYVLDTTAFLAAAILEGASLVGEGDGVGGSSGTLAGPLAEGGPYLHREPRVRRPLPVPERIPVHIKAEPTIVEVEIPRQPEVGVAADDQAVIAAFYAAGAIDEEEFTALIAA